MSDYAHVPGGSLKFKGAGEKKKKKKSHSSGDRSKVESEVQQSDRQAKEKSKEKGKSREERADSGEIVIKNVAPGEGRRMTESERKFEEVQRLRREERAKKTATQSHKDRVAEYNAKLERLSEHHDMPKIGPG